MPRHSADAGSGTQAFKRTRLFTVYIYFALLAAESSWWGQSCNDHFKGTSQDVRVKENVSAEAKNVAESSEDITVCRGRLGCLALAR